MVKNSRFIYSFTENVSLSDQKLFTPSSFISVIRLKSCSFFINHLQKSEALQECKLFSEIKPLALTNIANIATPLTLLQSVP